MAENDLQFDPNKEIMANLDFIQGKPVSQVPALAKLQAQRSQVQISHAHKNLVTQQDDKPIDAIEEDVWFLIKQKIHNSQEMNRMNGVLRSLLA